MENNNNTENSNVPQTSISSCNVINSNEYDYYQSERSQINFPYKLSLRINIGEHHLSENNINISKSQL